MKNSKQMFFVLGVVFIAMSAYQHGKLDAEMAVAPAKIGVINVADVLENTKEHKAWQEKMKTEQAVVRQEFEKMQNELQALQANLKLRTLGSDDYLNLLEEMTQKNALLEAKDKFYQTKVEDQMQQWTETLYQKLLKVTDELAKSKGIDVVIAYEELDLPAPSLLDFTQFIRAKKVLYYNMKYDLTPEVLAAMDNAK